MVSPQELTMFLPFTVIVAVVLIAGVVLGVVVFVPPPVGAMFVGVHAVNSVITTSNKDDFTSFIDVVLECKL
jgi:hypothetical protein